MKKSDYFIKKPDGTERFVDLDKIYNLRVYGARSDAYDIDWNIKGSINTCSCYCRFPDSKTRDKAFNELKQAYEYYHKSTSDKIIAIITKNQSALYILGIVVIILILYKHLTEKEEGGE